MKKTTTLLLLTLFSISAFAQKSVQGKVQDKKDEALIESATIRLLNAKDSSLIQGCFTDYKGEFSLPRIKNGNYIIEVRFLGFLNSTRNFTVQDKNVLLKPIYMAESQKNLNEVVVSGMNAQMAVKGDTIEYNPAAFKLPEGAVVEDLLKKLPGVSVDAAGQVTVNGEVIKKVRVNGKKFFEGDVTMATKNFTVDMVDKVQVIDQKSDMALLTGFEDDNTERIINLTVKKNRMKGIFGNVAAGGGADKEGGFRYDANSFLNFMGGEATNTTLILGANNVNNMRSGRGRGGMQGGGGGLIESQNIGVNNNTELSKTLKIGGNGSYAHTTNTSESSSERDNYQQGLTRTTNSSNKSVNENNSANLRLEMEWTIDTLTTLVVQPSMGYSNGNSNSSGISLNLSDGDSISWGNSSNSSLSNGLDGGLRFIFNRKSAVKKGRTFTMNFGGSLSNSSSDGSSYSKRYTMLGDTTIDQRTENKSNSYSGDVRVSFVEPLWNLRNFLEVAGSFSVNYRTSDRFQYNDNGDGRYTVLDSAYSNSFENSFYSESLELNFRHQAQTYSYMIGARAEPSQTYATTNYMNAETLYRPNEVLNFAPSAQFRYNFGRKQFARLQYRGRTSQPSIDQMQPVKTNNLMNETIGNPTLNPSFEHRLELMYSSFNQEHLSSLSLGVNGAYTLDALVSNTIYNATGKQYNQTVNAANAPFSGSANIMFNMPIIQKRLQFSTATTANYGQRFGYSKVIGDSVSPYLPNGDLQMGLLSKTISAGVNESINLTFTTDVVEIGLRGTANYKNTQNNLNANKPQVTVDYTGSGNLSLHLPYSWNISNDLNYTTRQGYSGLVKKDELVWNATIDKTVLNKKGTVSLKLNDILQQKLSVFESIGDNSRTLSRSNVLTSYFILSFSYRLASFGGGANAGDMMRGMRGGGGGGDRGGDRRGGGGGGGGGGFGGGDNFDY